MAVVTSGLLAYWNYNDLGATSGKWKDLVGTRHLIFWGGAGGNSINGVLFDGVDDYASSRNASLVNQWTIDTVSSGAATAYTLEMCIKLVSLKTSQSYQTYVETEGSTTPGPDTSSTSYSSYSNTGNFSYRTGRYGNIPSPKLPVVGEEVILTWVFDPAFGGNIQKLYENGVFNSNVGTSHPFAVPLLGGQFNVANAINSPEFANMYVKFVRVYNRALTTTEVTQNYDNGTAIGLTMGSSAFATQQIITSEIASAGVSTVTGTPTKTASASGTSAGAVAVNATVNQFITAIGTSAIVSTVTGTPSHIFGTYWEIPGSGTIAGAVAISATVSQFTTAIGTSAIVAAVTGTPTQIITASGTSAGAVALTGAITAFLSTTAATDGVSTLTGTPTQIITASGTSAGVMAVSAAVKQFTTVIGTASIVSTLTGTPTQIVTQVASGTSAGASTVTGTPSQLSPNQQSASGTSAGVSNVTGTTTLIFAQPGTSAGVSTVSGNGTSTWGSGAVRADGATSITVTATRFTGSAGTVAAQSTFAGNPSKFFIVSSTVGSVSVVNFSGGPLGIADAAFTVSAVTLYIMGAPVSTAGGGFHVSGGVVIQYRSSIGVTEGMSLSEIMDQVDTLVANSLPTGMKIAWVNQIQRQLFRDYPIPEMQASFNTTPGLDRYPFPSECPEDCVKTLIIGDSEYPHSSFVAENSRSMDRYWMASGTEMVVYPVPLDSRLVTVIYRPRPKWLTEQDLTTDTIPEFPADFQELLVLGCAARVAKSSNDTLNLAGIYQAEYERLSEKADLVLTKYRPKQSRTIRGWA